MSDDPISGKDLGETIRLRRKACGLTPDHLAAAFGVQIGTLHKWERGENLEKVVDYFRLLDLLGIDITLRERPASRWIIRTLAPLRSNRT